MGPVLFASGYLSALITVAAVSVYLLGFVERVWGANNSFQVLVWMSLVSTFVATVSFGLGAALMRRFSSNTWCLLLGVASGLIGVGLFYGYGHLFGRATIPVSFLAAIVPAVLASALGPRQGA